MRQGDKGEAVRALQENLRALGYTVKPDGILGPRTMGAMQAWLESRTVPEVPDWLQQALAAEVTAKPETPAARNGSVPVGAWAGSWALSNPDEAIWLALNCGMNRLDIVCNDHAPLRKSGPFRAPERWSPQTKKLTYPGDDVRYARDLVVRLANSAKLAGIEVHLMTWVMPFQRYLEELAEYMIPLAAECGAKSVQFDAEEPWMRAAKAGRMSYAAAASLIADMFKNRAFDLGVNAIKHAREEKLRPLTEICDYYLPQAYATQTTWEKWGVRPETVVSSSAKRYRTLFGADKRMAIGLACYRQDVIKGHTYESALATCYEAAMNVGAEAVVYWQLRHLRSAPKVRKVLASFKDAA